MGKHKKNKKPKAEGAAPPMALVGFKITDARTKTNTPKVVAANQPAVSNTGGAPPKVIDGMSVKKVKVVDESKQKVKPPAETTEVTESVLKPLENEEFLEAGNEEALGNWDDADENSFNFPTAKDMSNEESTVQDKQNNSWFEQDERNNQTVYKNTAAVFIKNNTCSSHRTETPNKGAVHKEPPHRNSSRDTQRNFEKSQHGKHDSSAWAPKKGSYAQGSHQEDMKKLENRGQNRSRERGTGRESGGKNLEPMMGSRKHDSFAGARKECSYIQGGYQEDTKKLENRGQNRSRERGTGRESEGKNLEPMMGSRKHDSFAGARKECSYIQGGHQEDTKKLENQGQNRSRERENVSYRKRNQEHNTGWGASNSSSYDYSQDKYQENRRNSESQKQSRGGINDSSQGSVSGGRNQEYKVGTWNSPSSDYSRDKYHENRKDSENQKQSRIGIGSSQGSVSGGRDHEYKMGSWNSSDYSRDKYRENRRDSGNQKHNRSVRDRSAEVGDNMFDRFWSYLKSSREKEYIKVKEIEGDLFAMPKEYALAHCVAEDMAMGSGIAVQFSRDFKRRDELLQQRAKQGGLAILEIEQRYIYYLVTKRMSTGKPTMETLWRSLQEMQKHIQEHEVTQLAMPRIGCGLDRLEWSDVKCMIEYTFQDTDIEIIICNFQQNYGKTKQKLKQKSEPSMGKKQSKIDDYLSKEKNSKKKKAKQKGNK